MSYNSVQFGIGSREAISDDATALTKAVNTPGQVMADNDPRRVNAIRVNVGGMYRTQDGATTQHGTSRAQLVDHGKSTVVGGVRTSVEAAQTLAKQAPHLAQSGVENLDAGELARAAEAADREEAGEDFDSISNPIGRQVVEELRGVGAGSTIPLVLALMAGDQRKVDVATQRLSEAMGEPVDLVRGKVQIGLNELARQTQRFVESHGADFHQFSDWAQKSHADTAASVMVRHMSGNGKVSEVWGPLLRMYTTKGGSKA